MMADLWGDVEADVKSAKIHVAQAIEIFASFVRGVDGKPDYLREMAFLHAMQSGYTSFEAALKRVFAMLGEPLPVGSDSHAALLRRANRPIEKSRPPILEDPLFTASDELRRFRHVAMHNYDRFDEERAAIAVRAAKVFLAEIEPSLARFRAVIDPD